MGKGDDIRAAPELRRRAERALRKRKHGLSHLPHDAQTLVHELETHQIELEMQNEDLRSTREELEDSRQQYADLYDSAPAGYFLLDHVGVIRSVNVMGARLLGKEKRGILGRHFTSFVAKEDWKVFFQHLKAVFGGQANQVLELNVVRTDHTRAELQLRSNLAERLQEHPERCRTVAIDITDRKRMERELAELNSSLEHRVEERTAEVQHLANQLRRLATELTQAEERERRRIAMILHEDLQQLLVGAKAQLAAMEVTHPTAALPVKNLQEIINAALNTSRSLTSELSPPILEHWGLMQALLWLATQFENNHRLKVQVFLDRNAGQASPELRQFLFALVRELLLNVVKHAGVHDASVTFERRENNTRIVVEDKGKGFDPSVLRRGNSGLGLFSMQQRLLHLGGKLEIQTARGKGTRITITVPMGEPAHDSHEGSSPARSRT